MESRAVLILLGVVIVFEFLFQGATASAITPSVTRAGGTCVDTENCCGSQNCNSLQCDNTDSLTVISIKNLNILCSDVLNKMTIPIIRQLIKLGKILTGGDCEPRLATILAGFLGVNRNDINCCNFSKNASGNGNGNCNAKSNSCYAECKNVVNRGCSTTITNQCGSDCCSYSGC